MAQGADLFVSGDMTRPDLCHNAITSITRASRHFCSSQARLLIPILEPRQHTCPPQWHNGQPTASNSSSAKLGTRRGLSTQSCHGLKSLLKSPSSLSYLPDPAELVDGSWIEAQVRKLIEERDDVWTEGFL
ncbi:hypothetical protein DPSP01_006298 [Paraphaeosphaeria sporulosa]